MNVLEAISLKKSFGSGKKAIEAVKDVSLNVEEGEIFGFLGPNGAGKTTTIKMIAGLITPDGGESLIMGKNPAKTLKALRSLGAVLEGNRNIYWRLTVKENIEYFAALKGMRRKDAKARTEELIKKFELEDKTTVQAQKLSRGMQQKVALAVSLVHRPKLLLLDEPTLGLDVGTAAMVKKMVRLIAQEGCAVLLTTHQLGDAEEITDKLAIIKDGQIIVEEKTKALIEQFSGESYRIELGEEIGDEAKEKIRDLGGFITDHKVEYLGEPTTLYQILDILRPRPIVKVEKDKANLTSIFLKLTKGEAND